jgi:hypothetical protein
VHHAWRRPFDTNDLDDGFDIDEWDAGSIVGTVVLSLANNNHEEGFDFNENNDGDLRVTMQLVEANGNGEEGIDLEEDDDFGDSGDLVAVMNTVAGGHGIELLESGAGDLMASVSKSNSSGNEGFGVFGDETGAGAGTVTLAGVTFVGSANALGETGGTAGFIIQP